MNEDDLKYTKESLTEAVAQAAESGVHAGIFAQKYKQDGKSRWDVSFCDDIVGVRMLPRMEEQAIMALYMHVDDMETEKELNKMLSNIIEARWEERNTIEVTEYQHQDAHDYYGVNRRDFY